VHVDSTDDLPQKGFAEDAVEARQRIDAAEGAGDVVGNMSWDIVLDAAVVAYIDTAAKLEVSTAWFAPSGTSERCTEPE
jgi:hypothetical protein